jgi:hypothetical protein
MTLPSVSYKRHRFPPAIIAHVVWLHFRFPLSLRLVEEMLLERGIVVSYETVRRWALKFGITPVASSAKCQATATSGTSMRSSSLSAARGIGCGEGFVTGTLIDSQRRVGTVLAHAAVAVLQVSNAPLLRMRSVFRDVRWRWVLKLLWTAA